MKKLITATLFISIIGLSMFLACEKETKVNNKTVNKSIQKKFVPTAGQLIAAARALGVEMEAGYKYSITYRTGYYYSTEVKILGGLLYSKVTTGCNPGDAICHISKVVKIGLSTSVFEEPTDDNPLGLIPVIQPETDLFGGYLFKFDEGVLCENPCLVFLVDTRQTNQNDWFNSEYLIVNSPIALHEEFAYELGVLPESQILPIGEYFLDSEGTVRAWVYEIENSFN
jgi:hypothetical protein